MSPDLEIWQRHYVTAQVLEEVREERRRQFDKFGEQNHPDGTGLINDKAMRDAARDLCDWSFASGRGTWRLVLGEEFFESLAETDPAALRAELVQVAAVAVAWIEAIDRRAS